MLDTINSQSELSNSMINTISSLHTILDQFPDQITDSLKNEILNIAINQMDLLQNGNIEPNPNLLNILDLSLRFSL